MCEYRRNGSWKMRSKCERQSIYQHTSASVCILYILLNTVQPTDRAYRLQRSLIAIQCGTCVLCINVYGTRQYQFVKSNVNRFTFLRIFRVLSFRVRWITRTRAQSQRESWNKKNVSVESKTYVRGRSLRIFSRGRSPPVAKNKRGK